MSIKSLPYFDTRGRKGESWLRSDEPLGCELRAEQVRRARTVQNPISRDV